MKVVDRVDLPRFMGDWYVIANIPTLIERGAHQGGIGLPPEILMEDRQHHEDRRREHDEDRGVRRDDHGQPRGRLGQARRGR